MKITKVSDRVTGLVAILFAVAGFAGAAPVLNAPEIGASSVSAMSLLCGGLAVLRGRRPRLQTAEVASGGETAN